MRSQRRNSGKQPISIPHLQYRRDGQSKKRTHLILPHAYIIPVIHMRIDLEGPYGFEHDLRRRVTVKRRPRQMYREIRVPEILSHLQYSCISK